MQKNQKGQALLFVVVAMTIALTVGVAVTSRTISSLKRTSSTDTASRVFSAAEGGVEWFLKQPVDVLDKLSDGNTNSGQECPTGTTGDPNDTSACVIKYQPQGNDKIQSKASIKVTKFSTNYTESGNTNYWFDMTPGTVKEVTLLDYTNNTYYRGDMDICWKSNDSTQSAALYYMIYDKAGVWEKRLVTPNTVVGTLDLKGEVASTSGKLTYDSCYTLNISKDSLGLRIKTLYAPANVAVFPTAGGLPVQGYAITSLGEIDNVSEKIKATKVITVYRSIPYALGAFDYAIYSSSIID